MELYGRIRRDARVEGLSGRELAKKYRVGRDTVAKALANAEPATRKTSVRASPKLGPFKAALDEMLRYNLTAPKKQRYTAQRAWEQLLEEHGAEVAYPTVTAYFRVRWPQIQAEAGVVPEAFVPQEHAPGEEAEVDFGEVWVILDGVKTKCHMFALRLSSSGKAIHRVYPTQAQEAFLEGHIDAFEELGGIPTKHIRYDNLKPAVSRVLMGRERTESERWVLFRSHFGFDAFYCRPGVVGAHEKGGVEGEIGRFRRKWMVPLPEVDSLAELNERIKAWDKKDEARRIRQRQRTVGEDFLNEQSLLAPVPFERFDPGVTSHPRVDRSSLISVRGVKYSVPVRLIGKKVRVSLRASELVIFDGREEVARHNRVAIRGGQVVLLDHYLEVLRLKPGAFPGSTALAQDREAGRFSLAHDAFWQEARKVNGDTVGTQALIDVLLLHRTMRAADVIAGIRAALSVGAVTADVVAVEARLHASGSGTSERFVEQKHGRGERVVSLTQRRLTDPAAVIAGLPPDRRPMPSVAHYDDLLKLKRRPVFTDETIDKEGTTGT